MYTVVRFEKEAASLEEMEQLMSELALVDPELSPSPGVRAPLIYSADVHDGKEWEEHCKAIASFIHRFGEFLTKAKTRSLNVVFDVAIWPDDYYERNMSCFRFDSAWIAELAEANVELEISLYNP